MVVLHGTNRCVKSTGRSLPQQTWQHLVTIGGKEEEAQAPLPNLARVPLGAPRRQNRAKNERGIGSLLNPCHWLHRYRYRSGEWGRDGRHFR